MTAIMAAPPHVWTARMIHPLADAGVGTRAPFVRRTFRVDGLASGAVLRISALGLYRCFINGVRVGDDQLTPGWTCYNERLSYQSYVVGPLLKDGDNVIDIWLGDGWYRSQMMWAKTLLFNTWGDRIGAIAEIALNGRVLVATDTDWRCGLSPILKSGIYFGEIYDAREEGRSAGQPCVLHPAFDPKVLIPHETNGVKELPPLPAVAAKADAEGRMVCDFAQNCAGYVELAVKGERGARVIVEHAEIVDQDGVFNNVNLRTAEARIEYVLKGDGVERYKPAFTFQGFRYARITIQGEAEVVSIAAIPISTAVKLVGSLTTGHALVNRLVQNTVWSQRSNFVDVPTDCPQRDERLGWSGDAQVFAPTACWLHDSHGILVKYVRDLMADQRPDGAVTHVTPDPTRNHEDLVPGYYGSTGWGDAIWVIPWTLYTHYGDRAILAEALPAMIRWADFVWSISDGPIVRPPRPWGDRGFSFGDWLQPSGPSEKPLPTIGDDAAATIYLYLASLNVGCIAGLLGDSAAAEKFAARAAAVKEAFAREFITPAGRVAYDDQTSYALAFLHDLIPEDKRESAKGYFKATIARSEGRIGTGFIGTPALLPALLKIGAWDLTAELFLQEGVPGWLYQVKLGATTIWERWNAILEDGRLFDPAMNSFNHYAYGAVCQWLFEAVAGVRPDPERPAFKHILFEPAILPALGPVKAHHDSTSGLVEAGWRVEDDHVVYELLIPAGSTGTFILSPRYADIRVDGAAVARTADGDAPTTGPLAPGAHTLTFKISG
jgi:alpha-L-rhamnosidase